MKILRNVADITVALAPDTSVDVKRFRDLVVGLKCNRLNFDWNEFAFKWVYLVKHFL